MTDAAIHIAPTLEDKVDLCQNAIDLALIPDLEAGNMLARQLSSLANADSTGLVLGARVPIILTSRAYTVRPRIASCAVTVWAAHARREALRSVTHA